MHGRGCRALGVAGLYAGLAGGMQHGFDLTAARIPFKPALLNTNSKHARPEAVPLYRQTRAHRRRQRCAIPAAHFCQRIAAGRSRNSQLLSCADLHATWLSCVQEPADAVLSATQPMVSAMAGKTATRNDKAKKRQRDAPKPPDGAQPAAKRPVAADAGHVPAGWALPAAQAPAITTNGAEGPQTGTLQDGMQPDVAKHLRAPSAAAVPMGQSEPQR